MAGTAFCVRSGGLATDDHKPGHQQMAEPLAPLHPSGSYDSDSAPEEHNWAGYFECEDSAAHSIKPRLNRQWL
eukprot:4899000-Pleurochrysis_carterae.AAC.1